VAGIFRQTEAGPEMVGTGNGFTVIVKVADVPVQVTLLLVKAGVTVMVAVTGDPVMLVAVYEAIFPVPEAARPMEVFELTQL
jgi:hypothetical protein